MDRVVVIQCRTPMTVLRRVRVHYFAAHSRDPMLHPEADWSSSMVFERANSHRLQKLRLNEEQSDGEDDRDPADHVGDNKDVP